MSSADIKRFLVEGFKIAPVGAVAWVTRFTASPDADGADWGGATCAPDAPPVINGENAYYSTAAFPADATARNEQQALGVWAILLDDIGKKGSAAAVHDLLGEPTARVQTSDGSEQWAYYLDKLETVAAVKPINDEIRHRGLSDKSGINAVRYGRLPGGHNTKAERGNYAVRLEEFHPERRFSLTQLATRLGVGVRKEKKAAYELPAEIPDGAHNDQIAAYALHLFNKRLNDFEIRSLVNIVNQERCKPRPMVQWKVDKCVDSARKKYEQGDVGDEPEALSAHGLAAACLSLGDFIKLELPAVEPIIEGLIFEQHIVEIVGWRGSGKTWVGLALAMQIARGEPFLGFKVPVPRRVLYVDGEMTASELKERCTSLVGPRPIPPNFMMLSSEILLRKIGGALRINNVDHQRMFEEMLDDFEQSGCGPCTILFDNLVALTDGSIDEDRSSDFKPLGQWFVKLRQRGYTIIFFHHTGKNGEQRGTSGHEDFVNAVFKIEEIGHQTPHQFTFTVDKFRSAARPKPDRVNVTLLADEHGTLQLATQEAAPAEHKYSTKDLILQCVERNERSDRKTIAAAVDKSYTAVNDQVRTLIESGLLATDKSGRLRVTDKGIRRVRQTWPDQEAGREY